MASSQQKRHTQYDVFLSFRGPDTRLGFTDHLYDALVRAGIRTFRDDDEIKKGHELKPEINDAIKSSRASIVILSKTYAVSRWCLDELSLILEQKRKCGHYVLPVFYHVEPTDVRNYRQQFDIKAKKGSKWTEDSVSRWKAALLEVGELKGITASGRETKHIAEVVGTIICELDLKLLSIPANLIGMESRAENIDSWLKNDKSRFLAIYGMGGAGKTTLAKYLYNSNKENFLSSCFLEEIGKKSKQPNGLLELRKQLLRDISVGMNETTSSESDDTTNIVKVLEINKVLIVLDDIDESKELSNLLGTKSFHTQSKIIITTRHLAIKGWFETISWRYEMCQLDSMSEQDSLALFSYHAFGSNIPTERFEDLTMEFVKYCGGNPLALEVLGCSLFVNNEDMKKNDNMVKIWKSRLNSLNSPGRDLDSRIKNVLQTSFDSLPTKEEKDVFLHIACFFVGEDADYVQEILELDYHATSGIWTLINRCLFTRSQSGKLMMHQLLQDMGRNIALSTDLSKRSRVWLDDESYHLLRCGEGSNNIEALSLDIRKLNKGIVLQPLKSDSLVKMKNLKLLRLNYVELKGSYKGFSEFRNLRWLCWHGCDIKTISSSMWMSTLVALDMTNGRLRKFEPPTVLYSLKYLDLTGSEELVCICNLWRLPNLEVLIFKSCISLTNVCETIKELKGLVTMMLRCCIKLKSLLCLPSNLEKLHIDSCTSLKKITFQSTRYKLQLFTYEGCINLSEVQGLFKLAPIAKLSEADLGYMSWIKAFKDHTVDLVGDEVTKGRIWRIQMLYEYGISSFFLKGINDPHIYILPSSNIYFQVTPLTMEQRIRGLLVTLRYRILHEDENNDRLFLLVKVKINKSTTNALTWVYNPVVYCKPRVGEVAEWLSYWPIGNMLEANDVVFVNFFWETEYMTVIGCDARLVYMNSGVVNRENNHVKEEEMIGRDLSEFEVAKGGYYLCRRDLFKPSKIADNLKMLFGDGIYDSVTNSQRWRKCRKQMQWRTETFMELEDYRDTLQKIIVLTGLEREIGILKKIEMMYNLGVPLIVSTKRFLENGTPLLIVIGFVDRFKVEAYVRKFEKMAKVEAVEYLGRSSILTYFKPSLLTICLIISIVMFFALCREGYLKSIVTVVGYKLLRRIYVGY